MNQQISISANLLQYQKTSIAQAWVCSIIANQMSDDQALREAQAAFLQWDTYQDGVLSSDEIEEHMAEICQHFSMEEPDVHKMFKAADVDGDGRVDYEEYVEAIESEWAWHFGSNVGRRCTLPSQSIVGPHGHALEVRHGSIGSPTWA